MAVELAGDDVDLWPRTARLGLGLLHWSIRELSEAALKNGFAILKQQI